MLALAACVALLATVLASALDRDTPKWEQPAQVDEDRITLRYVGGGCQSGSSVEVEETTDRVTLTVHTWTLALSCSEVGVPYDIEVELDAPLGDRELVDGAASSG